MSARRILTVQFAFRKSHILRRGRKYAMWGWPVVAVPQYIFSGRVVIMFSRSDMFIISCRLRVMSSKLVGIFGDKIRRLCNVI